MFINQSSPLFAITEKNNRGKEFDDFDFMGDGVVYFDKKQKDELDPYPTHYIHIQKIRLTKVNTPDVYFFRYHGMHLTIEKPANLATMRYELRLSLNSVIGF